MPPAWFQEEFGRFRRAIELAAAGDVERSRRLVQEVRGDDLRTWYVVHGQNSGGFRSRYYRVQAKITDIGMRSAPPASMVVATYQRDHYTCRYCGQRLFPIEVLRAYEGVVGIEYFTATKKNASHGAALVFRATYDHVEPLNRGGRHSLDNLVAACYSCNFGKRDFTLEQLGLDDPRSRPVASDDWDGLVSLLPKLRHARV